MPEQPPWWAVLVFHRCISAQLQQGRGPQNTCCCNLWQYASVWAIQRRGELTLQSHPVPFFLRHLLTGALPGAPLSGDLGGMGILFTRTWAKPLSHFTSDNARFLMLLYYFSFTFLLTTDFRCHISLCKMSEGWTEATAAHVFALALYRCKWWCKVKGKGKLYTLGQVVSLYRQHWLITDINSLINLVRL